MSRRALNDNLSLKARYQTEKVQLVETFAKKSTNINILAKIYENDGLNWFFMGMHKMDSR